MKKIDAMLNYAVAKIRSVPYKVSLRWVYYQCIQQGLARKSRSGLSCFAEQISRERKRFRNGWHPDILADSLRETYFVGHESISIDVSLNTIEFQDYYVQVWFEAQAMYEQFLHYTIDYRISLQPFRGDISIALKWQLAKYLEKIHKEYPEKPIKILYFGDCDKKGSQIPQSALVDIRIWCKAPFDFEFIGLTDTQAKYHNLPENPERPNQYQWESLNDSQAQELILGAVRKYLKPIPQSVLDEENDLEEQLKDYYDTL